MQSGGSNGRFNKKPTNKYSRRHGWANQETFNALQHQVNELLMSNSLTAIGQNQQDQFHPRYLREEQLGVGLDLLELIRVLYA